MVIVATGGVPDTSFLEAGEDLVTSVWDVLGGYVEPAGSVLLYDDHGWHQGPSTAVALAGKGVALEVVTPDRMLAFEVGATNFPNYLRELYRRGVKLTPDLELRSVRREGNRLVASFWNEYAEEDGRAGGRPGRGRARHPARGRALPRAQGRLAQRRRGRRRRTGHRRARRSSSATPTARYLLYRVGDAVSSRNIHAAIYDCAPALQGPLTGRQMTCAILARCAATGQLGIGVVSSLLAVTGRCAFVQAQVGAVVVQSMADPRLGPAALKLLAGGYRPEAVLRAFDRTEEGFEYRQVAVVNARGDTAVHSGAQAVGLCGAAEGEGCAALCNRLVDRGVPDLMVEACVRTKGRAGRPADRGTAGGRGRRRGRAGACGGPAGRRARALAAGRSADRLDRGRSGGRARPSLASVAAADARLSRPRAGPGVRRRAAARLSRWPKSHGNRRQLVVETLPPPGR